MASPPGPSDLPGTSKWAVLPLGPGRAHLLLTGLCWLCLGFGLVIFFPMIHSSADCIIREAFVLVLFTGSLLNSQTLGSLNKDGRSCWMSLLPLSCWAYGSGRSKCGRA